MGQIDVNYTITPQSGQSAISPLIYGCNWTQTSNSSTGQNYTLVRLGGNRATAYNWENNASNAGTDWNNSSDNFWCDYVGVPAVQAETPGIGMTTVIDQSNSNNAVSLVTVPMAGYVSADKDGTVTTVAPGSRWVQVVPAKGSAFTLTPDLTDGKVYVDEFVNFLKSKYGSGGVQYSLDNEPALWSSTHPLVHPDTLTCAELMNKTITTSEAIKAVDPNAEIYGFVSYGFASYLALQSAPDWPSLQGAYSWFIDYYLDQMKQASNAAGKRLVDVLDLHWYPEAMGDNRIVSATANTTNDKLARLQAPRTLWDPDYTENSWIGQYFSSDLPLLPKVQSSIDSYDPGTKMAFTEFQYGGFEDITGALALTDVLGIFGKYGVYSATHWDDPGTYGSLAYKLYRNYDGNNSTYGDENIGATMSDKVNSSVYASVVTGSNGEIHVIAINKSMTSAINGTFTIAGTNDSYNAASVYAINDGSTGIIHESDITFTGNSFTYTLPALSAYHFIIKQGGAIVPVTGISISPATASVNQFETTQLSAVFSPGNATNKGASWSSSDNSIATVSSAGMVTGISAGTVTITATSNDGGYVASSMVTVMPFEPPCSNPVSTALPLTIDGAGEYCFATSGNINYVNSWGADQIEINGVDFTNTYATNMPDRIYGNYYIHYKSSVSWAHIEIDGSGGENGTTVAVTGVSVSPTNVSIDAGTTTNLSATVSPSDASDQSVSWSSSNASVATVSSSGLVTGVSAGTATITVTTTDGNFTATTAVTVNPPANVAVTGVIVSPTTLDLTVGSLCGNDGPGTITATVLPSNASNKNLAWTTSNSSVATVSSSGVVTPVNVGEAVITVTTEDGNYSAICDVSVLAVAEFIQVTVSPIADTLQVGSIVQLTGSVTPSCLSQNVSWSTSNASIATVSSSGLVTGIAEGSATIIVTTNDGGFTASSAITVTGSNGTPCNNPTTISIPFTQDGVGDYCFVTSTEISYINSWNMDLVEINGVDFTNTWSNSLPAAINGNWYIHYVGSFAWSHFEAPAAKGAEGITKIAKPSDKLVIFPNPVQDHVSIVIQNSTGVKSELKVMDNSGRQIKSVAFEGNTYDLDASGFETGVYNIVVYTDNRVLRNTFVKE